MQTIRLYVLSVKDKFVLGAGDATVPATFVAGGEQYFQWDVGGENRVSSVDYFQVRQYRAGDRFAVVGGVCAEFDHGSRSAVVYVYKLLWHCGCGYGCVCMRGVV